MYRVRKDGVSDVVFSKEGSPDFLTTIIFIQFLMGIMLLIAMISLLG